MIARVRKMRDDAGMMLVIALIVITTVALVTGALLTHGWTNFQATVGLRSVAGTSYAADTAGKIAINNLRLGADAPGWVAPTFPGLWDDWVYTNNADGTGCFGVTSAQAVQNTLTLNNVYPPAGDQTSASSARVECTPVPGTGIFGGGAGVGINDPSPTDAFARALTTVGTSGDHGMTLTPLGLGNDAPMPMRGGVASRSFIYVDHGALVTDGYVWANGNCDPAMVVSTETICNSPGKVPVPATPASPLTSVPAFRDASAQGCNFQPGFYNSAARLTAAVNLCGVARFASGQYYFDFRDEDHSGQNVWTISTKVIGGVGSGNDNIPGACRSPILNDPIQGVQFVFGSTSRIAFTNSAQVELCGPSNGGNAPMTLYQQQTGSTQAAVPLSAVAAGNVDQKTGNAGGNKWTTGTTTPAAPPTSVRDAISAPNDSSAVSWLVTGNNDDIGLDLRNFPGLSGIPAGSDITSAQVRVKYAKASTKSLAVTVNGQTPANVTVSAPDGTGWGTANIPDQLRNLLQNGAFDANKPVLELRLMDANKDDTLMIDAVTLAVTYVPPSLRAATDVTFLESPTNFSGRFLVQGATYAPNGFLRVKPGNDPNALVAFRWGIVAKGVDFTAQPQQLFGYPLVSIPDAGKGLGSRVTVVDLKVYVCVQAGSCASGGTHALTARVMITDPPYGASGAPVPGRRQIKVLSWAEQN